MKEFYKDTYAKSIDCTVVKVMKNGDFTEVYTDKTVCYPECGGQPGDKGILGKFDILDTKKAENGDSIHILPADAEIPVGSKQMMCLNWEHRYKFMVMHTAQHMLSGMLFNMFSIGTVSVHLGDEYLTIETNRESIDQGIIDELVLTANDRIAESHKIIYRELSHSDAEALGMRRSIKVDGDVRIVEIEGVDRIACGGVHAASTSEIRLIVFLGQQKIRDHVRLFFVCGKEAQSLVYNNIGYLNNLKNLLDCSSYAELEPKIQKNMQQISELKLEYKNLSEVVAVSEINTHLNNGIAAFETNLDLDAFAKATDKFNNLALCSVNGNNWMIVLKGSFAEIDFNSIRDRILVPNNAKGGGKNGFYRGSCDNSIIGSFLSLF